MHCGIDFGTSNSVAGVYREGKIHLVPLENEKKLLPSTIFFNYETDTRHFGQKATNLYVSHTEGRLLRSLKSLLGSSIIKEKTKMKNSFVSLENVIQIFLSHIKNKIEKNMQSEITSITLGRPVFFVDNDPKKDREAQNQLEEIAKRTGFKNISFCFEPLAAARQYEQTIEKEEIALVMDLGGGTSDFSIIQMNPRAPSKVLANDGIHIGGTNIDHIISLQNIMPFLGFQQELAETLKTPNHLYFDLSTWHRIHMLYTQKKKKIVEELLHTHPHIKELGRLNQVIHYESGHDLLFKAKQAKID
ncbi:MAG: Hsp70 family protein, partial [Alphaproteobacteria bacterium]|nr:Hsp70 family protein [Alphaproteobacteria bacterium]